MFITASAAVCNKLRTSQSMMTALRQPSSCCEKRKGQSQLCNCTSRQTAACCTIQEMAWPYA